MGGLFLSIKLDVENSNKSFKVLCYIQQDNPHKFNLSQTVCCELGLIDEMLPEQINRIESVKENCQCPIRSKPPPVPSKIPFEAAAENREKLEKQLLEYYSASTINTCEHKPLPMMNDPLPSI